MNRKVKIIGFLYYINIEGFSPWLPPSQSSSALQTIMSTSVCFSHLFAYPKSLYFPGNPIRNMILGQILCYTKLAAIFFVLHAMYNSKPVFELVPFFRHLTNGKGLQGHVIDSHS